MCHPVAFSATRSGVNFNRLPIPRSSFVDSEIGRRMSTSCWMNEGIVMGLDMV